MKGQPQHRHRNMSFADLRFALGKARQFTSAIEAFVAHQASAEGEGTAATEAIAADIALRALRIIGLFTARGDRREKRPHQEAARDAAVLALRVAALRAALGAHIHTLRENRTRVEPGRTP